MNQRMFYPGLVVAVWFSVSLLLPSTSEKANQEANPKHTTQSLVGLVELTEKVVGVARKRMSVRWEQAYPTTYRSLFSRGMPRKVVTEGKLAEFDFPTLQLSSDTLTGTLAIEGRVEPEKYAVLFEAETSRALIYDDRMWQEFDVWFSKYQTEHPEID